MHSSRFSGRTACQTQFCKSILGQIDWVADLFFEHVMLLGQTDWVSDIVLDVLQRVKHQTSSLNMQAKK